MTDESVPNEPRRTTEADPPPQPAASTGAASASTGGGADGTRRNDIAPRRKPPLISAIEIENFKGIGAPARIELRPITLLFGQNSAGKSTVLHALCYAHEILTHRNVDAHRTELGGDRIDLGGFRRLVHGHDPTRTVRLRFELNLETWELPETLTDRLLSEYYDFELREAVDELARRATSGWVELQVQLVGEQPLLTRYEVGANDVLAGRIAVPATRRVTLDLNAAHPLLSPCAPGSASADTGSTRRTSRPDAHSDRVADAPDPGTDHWRISRVPLRGLTSVLPHWDEILYFDRQERKTANEPKERDTLEAQTSALVVGLGQALRDELTRFRYVGPLRDLSPRSDARSPTSRPLGWSDGSAAWDHLRQAADPEFIANVSRWLERKDRLDTGYRLRMRSIATVDEADATLLADMREYQQLRADFRSSAGSVDMDRWVRREAERIRDLERLLPDPTGHTDESADVGNVEAIAMLIKSNGSDEEEAHPPPDHGDDSEAALRLRFVRRARKNYQRLSHLVARMERREFTPQEIDDLMAAVAAHPPHTEPELVVAKTGLRVQMSDVGVGISQVLPVVVATLASDRPGITGIEQPELHLHPRIQVELGDLFAHRAQDDGVLLIETHSEHLLLRLMRRMRQTSDGALPNGASELRPADVSVFFVEIDPQCDRTLIREMPLNERGDLVKAWPGGFFEEDLREIF